MFVVAAVAVAVVVIAAIHKIDCEWKTSVITMRKIWMIAMMNSRAQQTKRTQNIKCIVAQSQIVRNLHWIVRLTVICCPISFGA